MSGAGKIAVVGSGPAALMAADVVSGAGHAVTIFEKRKSIGRKLLIAGSSGLNITNSLPLAEFARHYTGPAELWRRVLRAFTPQDWIRFIEKELGTGTFEGTSGRYFVEEMKAAPLLQAWKKRLCDRGVEFRFDHELTGFEGGSPVTLRVSGERAETFDAALLALGGASWEPQETPLRWPAMFREKGLAFTEFTPSNVGFGVAWPEGFLKEAEGKPLKNIVLTSSKGSRKGEAMITRYGMEGTPVYFVGTRGRAHLDLKPDLTSEQIVGKLRAVRENLSPIRRVKKQLNLCEASFALVFHCTPPEILKDPDFMRLARHIKALPVDFGEPRPLTESISSAGGLALSELDDRFMLRRHPGIFAAGEMLDWDVPTGGFLIQGCVSQGRCAGEGILAYLRSGMGSGAGGG